MPLSLIYIFSPLNKHNYMTPDKISERSGGPSVCVCASAPCWRVCAGPARVSGIWFDSNAFLLPHNSLARKSFVSVWFLVNIVFLFPAGARDVERVDQRRRAPQREEKCASYSMIFGAAMVRHPFVRFGYCLQVEWRVGFFSQCFHRMAAPVLLRFSTAEFWSVCVELLRESPELSIFSVVFHAFIFLSVCETRNERVLLNASHLSIDFLNKNLNAIRFKLMSRLQGCLR